MIGDPVRADGPEPRAVDPKLKRLALRIRLAQKLDRAQTDALRALVERHFCPSLGRGNARTHQKAIHAIQRLSTEPDGPPFLRLPEPYALPIGDRLRHALDAMKHLTLAVDLA